MILAPFYKSATKLRDKVCELFEKKDFQIILDFLKGLNLLKQARRVYETTRYDLKTGQHKQESDVDGKTEHFSSQFSRNRSA